MYKTLFLMSLIFSAGASAGGFDLNCSQSGSDTGYRAYITAGLTSANIGRETLAGVQQIATLKCAEAHSGNATPDAINAILSCSPATISPDNGFQLQVKQGGIAGLT